MKKKTTIILQKIDCENCSKEWETYSHIQAEKAKTAACYHAKTRSHNLTVSTISVFSINPK